MLNGDASSCKAAAGGHHHHPQHHHLQKRKSKYKQPYCPTTVDPIFGGNPLKHPSSRLQASSASAEASASQLYCSSKCGCCQNKTNEHNMAVQSAPTGHRTYKGAAKKSHVSGEKRKLCRKLAYSNANSKTHFGKLKKGKAK